MATRPTIDMPDFGPHCEAILESRHMDVIEMDAASNTGVDNMREIIDSVRYAPVSARYKVYIIDEVHMLSKSAFNALLKTLEEPPPHVKFIFATTEINKVPVTILSRCQRFDLKRLDADLLATHYASIAAKEGVEAEADALAHDRAGCRRLGARRPVAARSGHRLWRGQGEGRRRRRHAGPDGPLAHHRPLRGGDGRRSGQAPSRRSKRSMHGGGDPRTILNDLADYVHWVTRLKVVKEPALTDTSRTEAEKSRGRDHAAKIGMAHLTRAWSMLLKGIRETELHADPLMAAEMVLIRLAHAADLPGGEELAKLVKRHRRLPRRSSRCRRANCCAAASRRATPFRPRWR